MFFNLTYPDTYKVQVQHDADALVEKFTVNAENERARNLRDAFDKFFEIAEGMGSEKKQVKYLP
jgi:hypothetical protein